MLIKKILLLITISLIITSTTKLYSNIQNIKSDNKFYIKKGFSPDWLNNIPDDNSWEIIHKKKTYTKNSQLNIPSIPKRNFLSIKKNKAEIYTKIISFVYEFDKKNVLGLYILRIYENWEIYINGKLLKKAAPPLIDGYISNQRCAINLLEYIHPDYLVSGLNIIGIKIIGDPAIIFLDISTSSPYIVDEYSKLYKKQSKIFSNSIIFLYLFFGIYYILLYFNKMFFKDKKDLNNLYFGLLSIAVFFYLFLKTEIIYKLIFDTSLIFRLEFISLYLIIPIGLLFFDTILEKKISYMTIISSIFTGILILFSISTPIPFIMDILLIWQISMPIFIIYLFLITYMVFIKTLKKEYHNKKIKNNSLMKFVISSLFKTTSGNFVISVTIIIFSTIYDLIDAVFFKTGFTITKYTFLFIMFGMTLNISNKFSRLNNKIIDLNKELSKQLKNLKNLYNHIRISDEKYKILLNSSNDFIFSLNNDLFITSANNKAMSKFNITPTMLNSTKFPDLIVAGSDEEFITNRNIIYENLKKFIQKKETTSFKVSFNRSTHYKSEDILFRLESINIEKNDVILVTARNVSNDSMINYFKAETQKFSIENYIIVADEISHRLTRNIFRYIKEDKIPLIRIALREILINSIEHGNLQISFNEKNKALTENNYFELLSSRQKNTENRNKKIIIKSSIKQDIITFTIIDKGKGFDWEKSISVDADDPNKNMIAHGRGIILAKEIFDNIRYDNNGTKVILELIP